MKDKYINKKNGLAIGVFLGYFIGSIIGQPIFGMLFGLALWSGLGNLSEKNNK